MEGFRNEVFLYKYPKYIKITLESIIGFQLTPNIFICSIERLPPLFSILTNYSCFYSVFTAKVWHGILDIDTYIYNMFIKY